MWELAGEFEGIRYHKVEWGTIINSEPVRVLIDIPRCYTSCDYLPEGGL
jgi:hypothetical protein